MRIDGLERLHRSEARVVLALLNAVPEYLKPRLAVADSKFPAYVAARTSSTHGASRVPEDAAAFLAPHPVDLLPIPSKMKAEMRRLGLHTMGQIASLGERRLTDRFGLEGRRAWRLCTGTDSEAVLPMVSEDTVVERMSLSFPTSIVHALSLIVDTLLRRAYARPEMRGRYAGRASLRCDATGWTSWERSISFREPAGRWESASYAVRSKLESDPPNTSVEEVTLTLSSMTREHGTQMGLFDGPRRDLERRIAETERRLQDRLGGVHALYRVEEVAPWHPAPEMRALEVPVDPSAREAVRPLHSPEPVEVREGAEGEPVSVLYRRRWRRVARIDDRWMFDLWWLPKPVTRTYYRIDPGDGAPVTVFRDEWSKRWYRQSA